MAIFNLATAFVGTFAWFVASKTLNGNDMAVQIDANEMHLDYTIYSFNDTTKEIQKIEAFNLNTYDSIIKEKNENTHLIVKTVLAGTIFDNKTVADIQINLHCTENNYYTPFLSNILHFKFKAFELQTENISELYYLATNELESETTYTFFTTVKLTDINLNITNASVINNTITVYGLIDYDEALIDSYISVNHISLDNIPSFTNDLQYIRYGTHE